MINMHRTMSISALSNAQLCHFGQVCKGHWSPEESLFLIPTVVLVVDVFSSPIVCSESKNVISCLVKEALHDIVGSVRVLLISFS